MAKATAKVAPKPSATAAKKPAPRKAPAAPAEKNDSPSLSELEAKIQELTRQANAVRAKERAQAIAQAVALVRAHDLTPQELGFRSMTFAAKQTAKARPMKYTDGKGNYWSGIGKRPFWFNDALKAGKSVEDLLVDKPQA